MPTYSEILDSEIDAESPVTVSLMTRLRDNALAYWGAPAGTRSIAQQTSAPLGWTKITDNVNDRALRLVSGTVGSGGTGAFTDIFKSRTPTGSNSSSSVSVSGEISMSDWGHADNPSSGRLLTGDGTNLNAAIQYADNDRNYVGSGTAAAQTWAGDAMNFGVAYIDFTLIEKAV